MLYTFRIGAREKHATEEPPTFLRFNFGLTEDLGTIAAHPQFPILSILNLLLPGAPHAVVVCGSWVPRFSVGNGPNHSSRTHPKRLLRIK